MINWAGGCDLPHLVGFRCSTLHGSEVETMFPLQNADKDLHRDVVEAIDRTSVDRLLSLHFSLEVLNILIVIKTSNWWGKPRKGAKKGPKTIPTPSFPQPQWKLYGTEFSLEVWSKLLLPCHRILFFTHPWFCSNFAAVTFPPFPCRISWDLPSRWDAWSSTSLCNSPQKWAIVITIKCQAQFNLFSEPSFLFRCYILPLPISCRALSLSSSLSFSFSQVKR